MALSPTAPLEEASGSAPGPARRQESQVCHSPEPLHRPPQGSAPGRKQPRFSLWKVTGPSRTCLLLLFSEVTENQP